MFRDVPECSGMFRDVPSSWFYRRPLFSPFRAVLSAILRDEYLTSAVTTKEVEVRYSSGKIALKTARNGEKNMTHGSVNIFFKLLLKNLL